MKDVGHENVMKAEETVVHARHLVRCLGLTSSAPTIIGKPYAYNQSGYNYNPNGESTLRDRCSSPFGRSSTMLIFAA